MKKILLIMLLIACFVSSADAVLTYGQTFYNTNKRSLHSASANDPLYQFIGEVNDILSGISSTEITNLLFDNSFTSDPTSTEGRLYYNTSLNKFKFYDGGSWVTIEAGSAGNSLDGAYDVGNAITVDSSPVTLTTDTGSGIIAFLIDHGGASNNSDAIAIAMAGSGDGIQITCEDTDSIAARFISATSQTVSLMVLDGSTGNWIGADDVGMLHLNKDTALTNTGSSMLYILNTDQPIASAEGFLARFVSTGTARTDAYAVEIEVPASQPALYVNGIVKLAGQTAAGGALLQVDAIGDSGNADAMTITNDGSGDCLQITPTDTDSGGINMVAKAAGTVPLIIVDGVTGDWDGADNKGMINITHDTALVDAGATLLYIGQTTAVKSDAEGFLARFVSDATLQSGAFAVEIEVTNKQPALKVNNNVTIAGADQSGTLLTITHVGAVGDADAMTIVSSGSGDSLLITPTDVDSGGINIVGKAAGTVPLVILDSSTNNMNLADDKGQLLIQQDSAYAHAGAAGLIVIDTASTPISAAEGFLARFVHAGTAQTNAYAVGITVPASQPALKIDGIVVIDGQDSIGATLFQIVNDSGSDNQDAMSINTEGTGDGLQITCDDIDSVAFNAVAATSQTTSLAKFDGATGGVAWLGAQNVGMIHVTSDGALAHVDSSLLYIANSGVPQDDARGTSLRIIDTGNASAGTAGYSVYIKTDDATMEAMYIDEGNLLVDEEIVAGIGVQSTATQRTSTSDGTGNGLIARNTRHVTIVSSNASWQIKLPAPIVGMKITLVTPSTACELIATGSSVKINDVICSATNEALLVVDSHYEVTCVSATEWILVGYDNLGAHVAPIVPDSL